MVRTLHVPLDDKVYDNLEKAKGDLTWEMFLKNISEEKVRK